MWKELQKGWIPNNLDYSKEYYQYIKENQDELPTYLVGLVGFHYSYGGKWWGGFARSRYEDHIERSVNKTLKQVESMKDVKFTCKNYREYSGLKNAVIYCDPPYKKVTQKSTRYNASFNHKEFWEWCKQMSKNNIILVSEYESPLSDIEVLWEKKHNSNMSLKKVQKSNEKLFLVK